jgi:hypothetical protein
MARGWDYQEEVVVALEGLDESDDFVDVTLTGVRLLELPTEVLDASLGLFELASPSPRTQSRDQAGLAPLSTDRRTPLLLGQITALLDPPGV